MNEFTDGVEVPAEHLLIRTNDGRVFVDADAFATNVHQAVHMTAPIVDMMKGEDYTDGQHAVAMALHDAVDGFRSDVGLPPLAPGEDASEVQEQVRSLEEIFGLPAFGEPDA